MLPSTPEYPYLRVALPSEDGAEMVINTNLVGSYNADNVMAAIAVGRQFGISLDEAVKAISAYIPSNNRSQMTKTQRNTLIVDAYNANPTSMAAALDNFANVEAPCRYAMLGDMLELGSDSAQEHETIICKALALGFDGVFFVGGEFRSAVAGELEKATFFSTSDELASWLDANPIDGAVVLIKGSRGTRMEKVIAHL